MRSLVYKKHNLFAVLSVLLIFVSLLITDFYYSWQEYEHGLIRDARYGAIYAEETVGQIITILGALGNAPVLKSGDSKKIETFLNEVGDYRQVSSLALANSEGIRWAGRVKNIDNFDVSDQEFFRGAVETGKPYVTGAVRSKVTSEIEFVVSYPLYGKDGKLENVFYAPVSNSLFFEDFFKKLKLESGASFHIIDKNDQMLICSLKEVKDLKPYRPKHFSVENNRLFELLTSFDAKVTARQTVAGTSWTIIVDQDVPVVVMLVLGKVLYDSLLIFLVLLPVILAFAVFIVQINRQRKDLMRSNKKFQSLAVTDGLTGLLNHRAFQDTLAECIETAGPEEPLTLIMMDIDNFKIFNDQFGHQTGDAVLKQLGRLLMGYFKDRGFAARYGGEEFVGILPRTGPDKGLGMARQLSEMIRATAIGLDEETEIRISVSMGTATYPKDAVDRENLIKFADRALYKAKEQESNKVQMYYSVLEELRGNLKEDQDLMAVIHTLNTIINAKDKYTYGHSERVMNYATRLAVRMGLSKEDVENISIGAFLHDIGKIEIPGDILGKPGKLSDEEFEFIKKHPLIGAEIIKPIKSLDKARQFTLYHHERFDGKGYPFGLSGTQIPIYGRIAAVVDAFDAMTSNRPYQKVKTREEALEEIFMYAGSQFDPAIAAVFIEAFSEIGEEEDSQDSPSVLIS
ncbi:MAG TPA: diguanylate cyclase [Desulfobacteria bacterium]|nr:diguanylate cyclase [Desulfobacteria bacterium]